MSAPGEEEKSLDEGDRGTKREMATAILGTRSDQKVTRDMH